jgi:RNA polymerase sigma factor (TIGR02999 family)
MGDVTRILSAIEEGDAQAAEDLLPIVYDELRSLASQRLARERPGQTLQGTALVHEAYLRLIGNEHPGWQGRAHFFAAAAEAMRRILIERARRRKRIKHGGEYKRIDLEEVDVVVGPESIDMIALDEALARLTEEDKVKADLVKLRYFAGLTAQQAADLLGVSRATADRYWAYARAWLYHEMNKGDETGTQ